MSIVSKKIMWRLVSVILLVALLVGGDQWVKDWVVTHIPLGSSRVVIPGLLNLTYLQNRGAAFSILQDQQFFFIALTAVVVGIATYYLIQRLQASFVDVLSLTLVISGGLGNVIDRVRQGFVVDMFDLQFVHFAVFNVADACVSCGVVLLLFRFWRSESGSRD